MYGAMEEFSELLAHVEEFGVVCSPQFITVQLMTGEQMEVEIHSRMTYEELYVALHEQLSEEIRPRFFNQINLLLHGELVPWTSSRVVPAPEVYYLLLDPTVYMAEIVRDPYDAWNHIQGEALECFRVILRTDAKEEFRFGIFLYHPRSKCYCSLEDVEHEWVVNRHGNEELHLWMEQDYPSMDSVGMANYLMECAESRLEISLAGKATVREDVECELTTFEERVDWE